MYITCRNYKSREKKQQQKSDHGVTEEERQIGEPQETNDLKGKMRRIEMTLIRGRGKSKIRVGVSETVRSNHISIYLPEIKSICHCIHAYNLIENFSF